MRLALVMGVGLSLATSDIYTVAIGGCSGGVGLAGRYALVEGSVADDELRRWPRRVRAVYSSGGVRLVAESTRSTFMFASPHSATADTALSQ